MMNELTINLEIEGLEEGLKKITTQTNKLILSGQLHQEELQIYNKSFPQIKLIITVQSNWVKISNCKFKKLELSNLSNDSHVEIEESSFECMTLENRIKNLRLSFKGGGLGYFKINESFDWHNNTLDDLKFSDAELDELIIPHSLQINRLNLTNIGLKKKVRSAEICFNFIQTIILENNKFETLLLKNNNRALLNCDLSNNSIDNLIFEDFHLPSNFKLSNPNEVENKSIANVKLINIRFKHLASSKYLNYLLSSPHIIIENTPFDDLKSGLSINWPLKLYGSPTDLKKTYKSIKEYIVENDDNHDLESHFEAKRLEEYYKEMIAKTSHVGDKFDLFFKLGIPLWISSFGTKLYKPILWLLSMHLIMTKVMFDFLSNNNPQNLIDLSVLENQNQMADLFFFTLLPTHSLSYHSFELSPVISFFMRLVNGIFIYHIVLASRKHLLRK
jgi:hypothetical protein